MMASSYECPGCGKSLVVDEEPPGILHKCDDCVLRMREVTDDGE